MYHQTVCSCHVMYAFQSESTLYSWLNVKELLARSRHKIWSLSDSNWTWTHNHLVCKWTLNHLAKLVKWLSCVVSTYLFGAFDCMFLTDCIFFTNQVVVGLSHVAVMYHQLTMFLLFPIIAGPFRRFSTCMWQNTYINTVRYVMVYSDVESIASRIKILMKVTSI